MILKLKDPQPKHLGEVHYDGHWWALLEEHDGEIRACRPVTPSDPDDWYAAEVARMAERAPA